MNEVSEMEVSIIKNMMRQNGNKHIAQVMDLPINLVNDVVINIYKETGIAPKQLALDQIENDKAAWRQELQKAKDARKAEAQQERDQQKQAAQKIREEQKLLKQQEKASRPKPEKIKKEIVIEPPKANREAEKYHAQRKKEYDRKKFTTKDVDYTQMISVRVDDKTTIFIKPGESAVEARMNYLDREKIKKKKLYAKPIAGDTSRRFKF